ncbi:acyltransferase family protein [Pectobacterium aroidearum]|uniref:acyltransferase family protein n=1 Tax=Pectobacterium aroidearum TaxID=1201031 RepID=UPI0015F02ACD|nr:acyltransferase [Pectobacterium aroidearum]MBA5235649.1 acyltransferase [Pectobacterium aroidearum]UUE55842.1 acyltransferase [Pectobacterium aroidearum]UUE68502.1 acyltransferase [Pectobacterium aroidearum]UUE72868.1 acyltransferase [Pectobacterium aroidearum]UUE77211.1 acyltransferase [Pectobacterium aroidearum]
MKKVNKERFIGLEWLRFLLGCYVMIYHTVHVYPQRERIPFLSELTSMGFFATSTFFVLSGFLLAHVYIKDGRLREPVRQFWAKRFFNLYPIHIIALLSSIAVVTLMQWLAVPPEGQVASARFVIYDTNDPAADPETLRHYMTNAQLAFNGLLQVLMLQAWNPYFLTFNAPLWSLSTLFFFYLTFPLLAPRLLNSRHPWLWMGIVCLLYLLPPIWVIWQQQFGMPYTGLLQRGPIFRLPEFLAGILGYALFRHYRQKDRLPLTKGQRSALALFISVNFLVATWLFTKGEAYWYFLLHNGLLLPAQVGLVCLSALAREPDSAWLRHWSPRLGAASLSIFALHVPLFNLFRTLEQLVRGNPMACFSDWDQCIAAAGQVQLSMTGYIIFLLTTVTLCVLFQERIVLRVRTFLTSRFLNTNSTSRTQRTA